MLGFDKELYDLAEKYGHDVEKYHDGSVRCIINGFQVLIEFFGKNYMLYHYTKGRDNRFFQTFDQLEAYVKELANE